MFTLQTSTASPSARPSPSPGAPPEATANRGCGKSRMRQITDAANHGCGKSRMHPNTTKKRMATDIVSKRQKAPETGEANRVLINKNRYPHNQYTHRFAGAPLARASTLARGRAVRRLSGHTRAIRLRQGYPATPGPPGYARAMRLRQGYAATPGLCGYARAMRLRQGYPILPVPAILRVLR